MSFKKILDHPSANWIIKSLKSGMGVRKVAKELEEMYPNDKDKHITFPTLQKFRTEHLNIEKDTLKEIKSVSKKKESDKIQRETKKTKAYKELVEESLNLHIEIKQQLGTMHALILSRVEALFDKLSEGKGSTSDEANLQKYFQSYILVIEKWAKYIENIADYTIEANVNVSVIENQMAVMREAVWEIMMEMGPELAPKFLEKLDNKMKMLQYRQDNKLSFRDMNSGIKELSAKVENVEPEISEFEEDK